MTQAPALVQAVRKRDVARLRTLLAERADVNEESDRGVTAFQTAAKVRKGETRVWRTGGGGGIFKRL